MQEKRVLESLGIENETTSGDAIKKRWVPDPDSQMDIGYAEAFHWAQFAAEAAASGVVGNAIYDAAKKAVIGVLERLKKSRNAEFAESEAISFALFTLACAKEPRELWSSNGFGSKPVWQEHGPAATHLDPGWLLTFVIPPDGVRLYEMRISGTRTIICEVIVPGGAPDKKKVKWRIKEIEELKCEPVPWRERKAQREALNRRLKAAADPEFSSWRTLSIVQSERTVFPGGCGI